MHFPVGFKNVFSASTIAFFISATPAVTAFNFINLYLVVLLITLASEVFPHPGGPHNIILESLSAFIVLYSVVSVASMGSCAGYSAKVFGIILYAGGGLNSIFTPPYFVVRFIVN